jgi:phage/plasmid-associated DNA primase
LIVRLEGDTAAWRRRLVPIEYTKPKPETVIADLAQRILKNEACGVLNWMLMGLDKLRADDWLLHLTARQQAKVDSLLLESDSVNLFVRECLARVDGEATTVPVAFEAYVEFCNVRGWAALNRNSFGREIGNAVLRIHQLSDRNDIKDDKGKAQRGWKGLMLPKNST